MATGVCSGVVAGRLPAAGGKCGSAWHEGVHPAPWTDAMDPAQLVLSPISRCCNTWSLAFWPD
eukprot:141218-Rhodomonas_salina.1